MSRQRPWRADNPDAVIVARPSKWGNPYRIGGTWINIPIATRAEAVAAFRWLIGEDEPENKGYLSHVRDELAGRDLACWCPLDQPCHADVLLEIANS